MEVKKIIWKSIIVNDHQKITFEPNHYHHYSITWQYIHTNVSPYGYTCTRTKKKKKIGKLQVFGFRYRCWLNIMNRERIQVEYFFFLTYWTTYTYSMYITLLYGITHMKNACKLEGNKYNGSPGNNNIGIINRKQTVCCMHKDIPVFHMKWVSFYRLPKNVD